MRRELAGINPGDRRTGARARRREGRAGLAVRARTAHLRRRHDRRRLRDPAPRFLRGLVDARLGSRPLGRQVRQHRGDERDPCAAPRSGAAARLSRTTRPTRWPRAWRRPTRRCSISCASSCGGAPRRDSANSPSSRPSRAASSMPGTSSYYAEKLQAEAVLDLAGRAAPLLPAAARARRTVRGGRAACSA